MAFENAAIHPLFIYLFIIIIIIIIIIIMFFFFFGVGLIVEFKNATIGSSNFYL